jgi:hypothetical protein
VAARHTMASHPLFVLISPTISIVSMEKKVTLFFSSQAERRLGKIPVDPDS